MHVWYRTSVKYDTFSPLQIFKASFTRGRIKARDRADQDRGRQDGARQSKTGQDGARQGGAG